MGTNSLYAVCNHCCTAFDTTLEAGCCIPRYISVRCQTFRMLVVVFCLVPGLCCSSFTIPACYMLAQAGLVLTRIDTPRDFCCFHHTRCDTLVICGTPSLPVYASVCEPLVAFIMLARLPANSSQEMVLKYQLPGHSMEELISLRSNDDLIEFKVHRHSAACHLDHGRTCHILFMPWDAVWKMTFG